MTDTTGLVASVEIAREARPRHTPSGAAPDQAARLRVITGTGIRVVALVGREADLARAAARGALAGGADLVALIGTRDGRTFVERAEILRAAHPDVVVVLGSERGDADGLVDAVEALRFACQAQRPAPRILAAADERTRVRIATAFAVADVEALPDARSDAGCDALVARLRAIRRSAQGDVVLRDEALEAAARALAASSKASTVVLDVTGATVGVVLAAPEGRTRALYARLGTGSAADRVVARAGLDRVRRWLPRPIEAPALIERVFNRARWPDAVAAAPLALALEMSLAREAISHAMADAHRAGMSLDEFRAPVSLVLTGRLAELPRAAQAVLVAMDGLELAGTTLVSRDRGDALVAAGALASRSAHAVMPETEKLALVAVVWPRRSATVRVTDATGPIEERIARGALVFIPTTGAIELTANGANARGSAEALGLGVIIDARGRPLALPPRDSDRIPTLARWHAALDALPKESV